MENERWIRIHTAKAARIRKTLIVEGFYPTGLITRPITNRIIGKLKKLDNEDLRAISGLIDLLVDFPADEEEKKSLFEWERLDGEAALAEARANEAKGIRFIS